MQMPEVNPAFSSEEAHALALDRADELAAFRRFFRLPTANNGKPAIYFCGNSLGLQSEMARRELHNALQMWEHRAIESFFESDDKWLDYHSYLSPAMARLVGALPEEVVVMNTLTVNLHLMMVSFYRPEGKRRKILIEGGAFPSDIYALSSQLNYHGFDPAADLVRLEPKAGEALLHTEDILEHIRQLGDELALVMLGGVNYYTGQWYDMAAITEAGHRAGARVGWDLAHAVGNVPMQLHDWGPDFAVWCNYKYVNGGPGTLGGAFVHQRHAQDDSLPRFAGWWGQNREIMFQMGPTFDPEPGADGWQLSTPPILSMAALRGAVEVMDAAGIDRLREKSVQLTGYLEYLLEQLTDDRVQLITPRDAKQRGCQLSLIVKEKGKAVFDAITEAGVICDWREPEVIRVAPVPLYNTFHEVWRFVQIFQQALSSV